MSEETEFYSDSRGVRVTDKRVILEDKTYALANITSVATFAEQPSRRGPILFVAVGLIIIFWGIASLTSAGAAAGFIFGGILAALGVIWYKGCKPIWHLKIASASGEQSPLHSTRESYITGIANAINAAIVHRA